MANVVVFGVEKLAELAHFYLTHDSEHKVVAFTVDPEYLTSSEFKGLPMVPYNEIEQRTRQRQQSEPAIDQGR